MAILQSETGLALVYFSFFLVMYREGLPSPILVFGFSLVILIVLTLLIEQNLLAVILTLVAAGVIYELRRKIKRKRSILFFVIGIWILSVGVQRFAIPYFFNSVLKHSWIGIIATNIQ